MNKIAWRDRLLKRAESILEKVAKGKELSQDERLQAFGWILRYAMDAEEEKLFDLDEERYGKDIRRR